MTRVMMSRSSLSVVGDRCSSSSVPLRRSNEMALPLGRVPRQHTLKKWAIVCGSMRRSTVFWDQRGPLPI
jgi:hypothetical protein